MSDERINNEVEDGEDDPRDVRSGRSASNWCNPWWVVPLVVILLSLNAYQWNMMSWDKFMIRSLSAEQNSSADPPAPPAPADDSSQSVSDDTVPVPVSNAVPNKLVGMTLTFNAVVGKLIFSFRDGDKVQITDTALDELYQQVADVSLDKAGNMTFKEYKKYYTVIYTASLNGNVVTITSKGIDKNKPHKVTSAYDPMTMVIN